MQFLFDSEQVTDELNLVTYLFIVIKCQKAPLANFIHYPRYYIKIQEIHHDTYIENGTVEIYCYLLLRNLETQTIFVILG